MANELKLLGYKNFSFLESSESTLVAKAYLAEDQRVVKIISSDSQELSILQSVAGKPHIISLHRVESIPNTTFVLLEMPFKEDRPVGSDEELKDFSRQLVEVIVFLHQQGIYYRDVKRSNIRWDGKHLVLIDFSCSMNYQDASNYPSKAVVGTRGYMAPEVLDKSKPSDIRADIWSIGVVLAYEWVRIHFGIAAAGGVFCSTVEELKNDLTRDLCSPKDFTDLIFKLMDPDPTKRLSEHLILQHPYFTSSIFPHKLRSKSAQEKKPIKQRALQNITNTIVH
jgi:serine/threonine protein kinase